MKILYRSVIFFAFVAACFIPSAVWAQTPGGPPAAETKVVSAMPSNYFAVKAGAYFPEDKWDVLDLGVFEYSLDTGFNGDLVFGHYFNRTGPWSSGSDISIRAEMIRWVQRGSAIWMLCRLRFS